MKAEIEYLVDEQGNRTKVLLPVEVYEAMTEYMADLDVARAARERKNEETIPWEQIKAEMVAEGILDA